MQKRIGLKELREDVSKYETLVKKGYSLVVYRKTQPLFRLMPIEDDQWEEVIDFTKIKKGGVRIDELLERL